MKSGYLLGAHPRKQFIAQFAGIFIGTVVSVFAFTLIVDKPEVIGSDQFPAPAAQTWAAVAQALSKGFEALAPVKVWSIVIGGVVGIVFTILPVLFPKQEKYLPSASGFGLAWIFQWYYGVLFFMGAVIAWWFAEKIAGEGGGIHVPRGVRRDGRRRADGRGDHFLAERAGDVAEIFRPLTSPDLREPWWTLRSRRVFKPPACFVDDLPRHQRASLRRHGEIRNHL